MSSTPVTTTLSRILRLLLCALPVAGYREILGGIAGVRGGAWAYETGSAKKAKYTRARNMAAYLEYRLAPYSD